MSKAKIILIRVFSFLVSCVATVAVNYFITSNILSRLGISSGLSNILILFAQLFAIYVFMQLIIFRKLTGSQKILLTAAYGMSVVSALFLRYPLYIIQFCFRGNFFARMFCWNPISFIFDFFVYPFSLVTNLLNIALFVPLVPIFSLYKRRPEWWMVITSFAVIELLQVLFNCGFFDMGDIVLYTLGYLCGAGIVRMYINRVKKNGGESSSDAAAKLTRAV